MLERGRAGEAYNISAGCAVPVGDILRKLAAIAGVAPELETDPSRYRPTDRQPMILADKLRRDTGWSPRYTLDQSLADIYAWVAKPL